MTTQDSYLDSVPSCWRPFLAVRIRSVWKQRLEELVATATYEIENILHQSVLVFVRHARDIVHHISSVMLHKKLGPTGLEVGIRRQHSCTLYKAIISSSRVGVRRSASVIEGSENSWRFAFLDQITNDFVVEIVDGGPFNLLPDVLLLLSLEGQLDEDLLEFFVDVVDTQLFKRVILQMRNDMTSV